jgi:hypothetical protein
MSLYEVLVLVALAGVGGYAYYLYRSDTRRKSPASEAQERAVATGRSMFGREPHQNGDGPGA